VCCGMPSKNIKFDVHKFLANIGEGRKILRVQKKNRIFAQGDACDAIFYINNGKVRLTVVSESGKEATIAILNPTDFFGEGGLTAQVRDARALRLQ
jgi:CRP/FNR family cyclic AMP-dependent transcriptional regulator